MSRYDRPTRHRNQQSLVTLRNRRLDVDSNSGVAVRAPQRQKSRSVVSSVILFPTARRAWRLRGRRDFWGCRASDRSHNHTTSCRDPSRPAGTSHTDSQQHVAYQKQSHHQVQGNTSQCAGTMLRARVGRWATIRVHPRRCSGAKIASEKIASLAAPGIPSTVPGML